MTEDAILAREAFLIYQNALGFAPYQGKLTEWKGFARDSRGNTKQLTIIIPNKYPEYPPQAYLPEGTSHSAISEDGRIITRSIKRWRQNMHAYQIIREARELISNGEFTNGTQLVEDNSEELALNRQLVMLKDQLAGKKQELENLRSQPISIPLNTDTTLAQITEDHILNIENDLYALEESYDSFEIDGLDFAKKFLKLQKKYYMFDASKKKHV